MAAVVTEFQLLDGNDRGEIQRPIKMRKQRAPPRGFPFELRSQPVGIERHEQEARLPGEMASKCTCDLIGGGEMDEAVPGVVRRARKAALTLCRLVSGFRDDFVNGLSHGVGGD